MTKRSKKRPAPRSKKTSSTALARRADVQTIKVADPDGLLAPVAQQLGELAHTAGIGITPIKLTRAEEKVLAKKLDRDEILVHPKGFIYLPHPYYTDWMNQAFGRGGWAVVPSGKPTKTENLIIVPHVLYVRGVPVAFAYGGAEFIPTNKQQTYDDVLESTTAYAMRRLCKRFGMALDLWRKRFIRAFLAERAIQVEVQGKGRQWRRKIDEPLVGELQPKAASRSNVKVGEVMEPEPGNDGSGNEKISAEQRRRLVSIWRKAGRADADVLLYLQRTYKVAETANIKRKDYNAIERAMSARGELPLPGDGV
jgi:hypothetical protein